MSQKFLLKWNKHMNVMNEFKHFLSFGIMVDVTLACDGQSLKAHKIVLSACSSFFRSLFLENPCKHPIVILKDIKYTELKAIIDFMYCGEVYVAENQVSALIKVAQTLRVKGLGEVESQDNQFGNESQNPSYNEFEDPATKTSESHPGDKTINRSFCSSDVPKKTFGQKQSVIEQNDNVESAPETVIMENLEIKQEVSDDMNDSIPDSNASMVPLEFPKVNFSKSKLKKPLQRGSVLEENFQDSAPNLERQTPTTDNLPGKSFQSLTQLNKELHQNHSDYSSSSASRTSTSSASGTSTPVSSDAILTDNQQPSTSSASTKRPAKKSVRQPLQKKVKIAKKPFRKSVKQPHNLRTPEVVIISDSNSVKDHDKTKEEKNKKTNTNTKNEVILYKCKMCPFKTKSRTRITTHLNSRHPGRRMFKCGQCAHVAYGKYKFERHIEVHQTKRPYHCSLCTYRFNTSGDLSGHVKRIHKLERPIFKCKNCDFSAPEQVSIEKHMIEVHERIPAVVIDKLPEQV